MSGRLNALSSDSDSKVPSDRNSRSGTDLSPSIEAEESFFLKENANQAFKIKNYRKAVDLYTKALEASTPSTSVELKRTILANRAQAYICFGDIHTALRDINLALSLQYTFSHSPKGVTMKCHFRRARLFCMFARYSEALSDYEEFEKLRFDTKYPVTTEDENLKKDIGEGIRAVGGPDRQRRDELIRAVDSRGLMLRDEHRPRFPLPPQDVLRSLGPDFDPDEMCLGFNTRDGRADLSLPDHNKTPISIPVYIIAPYFQYNSQRGRKTFRTREEHPVSENSTIGSLLENLFSSVVVAETGLSRSSRQDAMRSALAHDSAEDSVVYVPTFRGRFFVVPRKTTFREIFAGARWPRDGPLPFEDARETPRVRDFEVDGVELGCGWFVEVWVIPKEQWEMHCQFMDSGLGHLGTV